jgi:hypothetical protein
MSTCARTRKETVTDRAKRYRANQAGCLPSGPRRCALCESRRFLTVDHKDGFEANGAKSNLRWLCKSCNTRLGAAMAKKGKGRRTAQYNPSKPFRYKGALITPVGPTFTRYTVETASGYKQAGFHSVVDAKNFVTWKLQADKFAAGQKNPSDFEAGVEAANMYRRINARPDRNSFLAAFKQWKRAHKGASLEKFTDGFRSAAPAHWSGRNPTKSGGAANLFEYVLAGTQHVRHAHDAGGLIIHNTPKSKRREYAAEIWAKRSAGESSRGQSYSDEPDWVRNPGRGKKSAVVPFQLAGMARPVKAKVRKLKGGAIQISFGKKAAR